MVISVIDVLLFVIFGFPVAYLAFFAIGSMWPKAEPQASSENPHSFLILIPAYKEDGVILGCVEACLFQNYPKEKFDVLVIAEGMGDETMEKLALLPIKIKNVILKKRTKAKALNKALKDYSGYDVALVLDADNIMEPDFLSKFNVMFNRGATIVQGHRTAKNQNNSIAVLDAMSEEINNSIFRKGHYNLGLSSALIGSGMAFKFSQFKSIMSNVDVVGGFDKELEHIYLMNKVKIHYLHHAIVLDEKIQRKDDFTQQRRRWMAAQIEHLARFVPLFRLGVRQRNLDFCDKVYQMLLLPRILILGGVILSTAVFTCIDEAIGFKWQLLLITLLLSLFVAIPRKMVTFKLFKALFTLPQIFIIVLMNMFKLRNANKKFIHTPHGTT
ncbi:MAG: glycosyltransferase [Bacteroidales bacterium]|nr:glycosyltransferase [Bacteroidales bacterium]